MLRKRPSTKSPSKVNWSTDKHLSLTEDCFGILYDDCGRPIKVKRFTWKNHNGIQIQVITYGARVTSIKVPDRKGIVDDILLGFDNLAGYLHYGDRYFGATIGRVTGKLENATFVVDGAQHWVTKNAGKHHFNGGTKGFDKVVWESHVVGRKVVMSYVSPDGEEGYPGHLFVKVTFELTTMNEFLIDTEAVTTKSTLVDLSNLIHFNLGGHSTGPKELYRHIVTINANCYTVNTNDGFPSGEIRNVMHTDNDFLTPKTLKTRIGLFENDGYDQHFCISRGYDQEICFTARALHVPSGRVLEMYTNQYGVYFTTANDFGDGLLKPVVAKIANFITFDSLKSKSSDSDNIFVLLDLIHSKMLESTDLDEQKNFTEVQSLVNRLGKCTFAGEKCINSGIFDLEQKGEMNFAEPDFALEAVIKPLQMKYLEDIRKLAQKVTNTSSCSEFKIAVNEILDVVKCMDTHAIESKEFGGDMSYSKSLDGQNAPIKLDERMNTEKVKGEKRRGAQKIENVIPDYYKDGRIHGKNCAIYKRHGFVAFRSQNYPNAIYHKNFPSCVLNPGETYKHKIVYKFWVQSGDNAAWIRRDRYT